MRCLTLLALSALFALAALPAAALGIDPEIDFRDGSIWSGANSATSYTATQAGTELTISAAPTPAKLWWDRKDGLGIRLSYEHDEIESDEILTVVFKEAVSLEAIYVADLFIERGYVETGAFRVNGGAWRGFDAASLPGSGENGEHVVFFDDAIAGVELLEFSAPGKVRRGEHHEFALLGLDVEAATGAVPEPGAAMLFGAGMIVAARGLRRR